MSRVESWILVQWECPACLEINEIDNTAFDSKGEAVGTCAVCREVVLVESPNV